MILISNGLRPSDQCGGPAPRAPGDIFRKRKEHRRGSQAHTHLLKRTFLRLWLLAGLVFAASQVHAQPVQRSEIGRGAVDGREVIFFDEGLWRYAEHVECHDIPEVGMFCSDPAIWTEFPAHPTDLYKRRPRFTSGDSFWAQATALTPLSGDLSSADVEAFIRNRVFQRDGTRPTLLVNDTVDHDGVTWRRFVFDGGGLVRAFVVADVGKRVVIVETHEGRTTLFGRKHRDLQKAFIENQELYDHG